MIITMRMMDETIRFRKAGVMSSIYDGTCDLIRKFATWNIVSLFTKTEAL